MKKEKVAMIMTNWDMPAGATKPEPELSTPAPLRKGLLEIIAKSISNGLIFFVIYNATLIYRAVVINYRLCFLV